MTTLTTQFPRFDFLLATTRTDLHILVLNAHKVQSFPCLKEIGCSIFIGHHLIVLFQDRTSLVLRFQHEQLQFLEDISLKFDKPLTAVRKCSKKLFGSEIAVGITADGHICLINEEVQTNYIDIGSVIKE